MLVSLAEEVVDTLDVVGVVPVRFHLAPTEDGGVSGDMEVVPVDRVRLTAPAPKGVSYHHLRCGPSGGGWRCEATIEV